MDAMDSMMDAIAGPLVAAGARGAHRRKCLWLLATMPSAVVEVAAA